MSNKVTIDNSVRIEQLKYCAETIIKHANDIVGQFERNGKIVVTITIDPMEQIPSINVNKDMYPNPGE